MQDAPDAASDENTVAQVMDWLMDRITLTGCFETIFSISGHTADGLGVSVWHAGACSSARVLGSLAHCSERVLPAVAASVHAALQNSGM